MKIEKEDQDESGEDCIEEQFGNRRRGVDR